MATTKPVRGTKKGGRQVWVSSELLCDYEAVLRKRNPAMYAAQFPKGMRPSDLVRSALNTACYVARPAFWETYRAAAMQDCIENVDRILAQILQALADAGHLPGNSRIMVRSEGVDIILDEDGEAIMQAEGLTLRTVQKMAWA